MATRACRCRDSFFKDAKTPKSCGLGIAKKNNGAATSQTPLPAGTMDQSNKTHRKPKEKKKFAGELGSPRTIALCTLLILNPRQQGKIRRLLRLRTLGGFRNRRQDLTMYDLFSIAKLYMSETGLISVLFKFTGARKAVACAHGMLIKSSFCIFRELPALILGCSLGGSPSRGSAPINSCRRWTSGRKSFICSSNDLN